MFVDDGEDGLVGDAIAGLSGCGTDQPGFGLIERSVDVVAEGRGHGLGVRLGGVWGGGGEGVLPIFEHGGARQAGWERSRSKASGFESPWGCFRVSVPPRRGKFVKHMPSASQWEVALETRGAQKVERVRDQSGWIGEGRS